MIDVSKCEYEESFRDEENNCTVYYFTYPKDLGETEFYSEEDYGNVVSMCISLTVEDGGGFYMQMSPTVEEDDAFTDVDWRSLYLDRNYTEDTIQQLLDLAPVNLPTEMEIPLSGDYGNDLFEQICDYASDFLSEQTGFCHEGFEIDIQIKMKRLFYHGTTDVFPIRRVILPALRTGNLREEWRKKYNDKVFFTSSPASAYMFAKKACVKYGGNPVVYIVKPIGQYFNTVNNEFIADKAIVVGIEERK